MSQVVFVACHGGPADHFATFAKGLQQNGYTTSIHATGPALAKFNDHKVDGIKGFSLNALTSHEEDRLAISIAKANKKAAALFTDVGHAFAAKVQEAFKLFAKGVRRIAYYDNPEKFVPGGYSQTAAKVIPYAEAVVFASPQLQKEPILAEANTQIDLPQKKRSSLGYYPVEQAETLFERRKNEHAKVRAELFAKHDMNDQGQKVLVYFGGNNTTYFEQALPAFIASLKEACKKEDLSQYIIVLQQHPGAKEKNLDKAQFETCIKDLADTPFAPKIVIPDAASDKMQVVADAALYYQTSMGPQFAIANIPTIQVAHETYEDVLVRNKLCAKATNADELIAAFKNVGPFSTKVADKKAITESLGIRKDWLDQLKTTVVEQQATAALKALQQNFARAASSKKVAQMMRQGGHAMMAAMLKYAQQADDKHLLLATSSIAHRVLKNDANGRIKEFRDYMTTLKRTEPSAIRYSYECEKVAESAEKNQFFA